MLRIVFDQSHPCLPWRVGIREAIAEPVDHLAARLLAPVANGALPQPANIILGLPAGPFHSTLLATAAAGSARCYALLLGALPISTRRTVATVTCSRLAVTR